MKEGSTGGGGADGSGYGGADGGADGGVDGGGYGKSKVDGGSGSGIRVLDAGGFGTGCQARVREYMCMCERVWLWVNLVVLLFYVLITNKVITGT